MSSMIYRPWALRWFSLERKGGALTLSYFKPQSGLGGHGHAHDDEHSGGAKLKGQLIITKEVRVGRESDADKKNCFFVAGAKNPAIGDKSGRRRYSLLDTHETLFLA